MTKVKITKEQLEECLKSHTTIECAEYFGVCDMTIYNVLKKYGIETPRNKRRKNKIDFSKEQENTIIKSLVFGASIYKHASSQECHLYFSSSSEKICNYFFEKLKTFTTKSGIKKRKISEKYCAYCFRTISNPYFTELKNGMYKKNQKTTTKNKELIFSKII
jgi:hypothetical protein